MNCKRAEDRITTRPRCIVRIRATKGHMHAPRCSGIVSSRSHAAEESASSAAQRLDDHWPQRAEGNTRQSAMLPKAIVNTEIPVMYCTSRDCRTRGHLGPSACAARGAHHVQGNQQCRIPTCLAGAESHRVAQVNHLNQFKDDPAKPRRTQAVGSTAAALQLATSLCEPSTAATTLLRPASPVCCLLGAPTRLCLPPQLCQGKPSIRRLAHTTAPSHKG